MPIYMLSDTANLNNAISARIESDIVRAGGQIAYISASVTPGSIPFFEATQHEYAAMNSLFSVDYFDSTVDPVELQAYGVWHFSGGNSFDFINRIDRAGFGEHIYHHLEGYGLIVGVSAGAIVLTPSLGTSRLAGDAGHGSRQGLGIVDFEFYPHYSRTAVEDEKIYRYARETSAIIFACSDSDGMRVSGEEIKTFGDIACFNGSNRVGDRR